MSTKTIDQEIDIILRWNKKYWNSVKEEKLINNSNFSSETHKVKYDYAMELREVIKKTIYLKEEDKRDYMLKAFKNNGLNFDIPSEWEKRSILHELSSYNSKDNLDYELMKTLLKYGADPNSVDQENITPLMSTIQQFDKFLLLMKFGADPDFIPLDKYNNIEDYMTSIQEDIEKNGYSFLITLQPNTLEKIQGIINYMSNFRQRKDLNKEFNVSEKKKKRQVSL